MSSERARDAYDRGLRPLRSRSWSSSSRSPSRKRQRTSSRRRDSSRAAQAAGGYSRRHYTRERRRSVSRERRRSVSSSPRRYPRRSKHSRRSKSNTQGSRSAASKREKSQSPKLKVHLEDQTPPSIGIDPMSTHKVDKTDSKKGEKDPSIKDTKEENSSLREAKEKKEPETDDSSDSDSSSSSSSDSSSSSSDSSSSSSSSSNDGDSLIKKREKDVRASSKDVAKKEIANDNKRRESKCEESGEEDGEIDSNELYTTKAEYHTRKKGHLFCAGFPLTFRSVDLMEFFQDFGAFDAKIVERGGKRFGFVDFISEERAELARFALNGKRPAGEKFPIFVTEKTERGSVSHWVRETETGGPRFRRRF